MPSASSAENAKAAPNTDLTGKTLGDFLLEKKLGQGGMGQVYLAEQLSLKRKVAVKVMRPDVTATATSLARFKSEAQAVARLTHPNIVQVYMIQEQEGMHYIAFEFVEGTSLGQYMSRKGALPVPVVLKVLKQVAAALDHAGEAGIVHRDIKPENILITRKADAKVTDFGLARSTDENEGQVNLTQSGVVVGTPVYMSPEQVQGKKPDCRTDIYSLGVTAYHMLAGKPPFRGESAFELALQHVQGTAVPLRQVRAEVPEALEAIVARMMAKEPGDRYPNGRELLKDLNQVPVVAGDGQVRKTEELDVTSPRRRNSTLHLDPKPASKRAVALWIGLGAVVVLLPMMALGAFLGWRAFRAAHPPVAQRPPEERPPEKPPEPPPDVRPPERRPDAAGIDPREEERLRQALPKNFSLLSQARMMREIEHFLDLANYLLRTKQWDKAEKDFTEWMRASEKPQPIVWLGEICMAVVISERGDARRSNEILLALYRRSPNARGHRPLPMFHHHSLKPFVLEALDRNARAGELPEDLKTLRASLSGRS